MLKSKIIQINVMLIDLIYINASILISCFTKKIGSPLILLTIFNILVFWPHLKSDGHVDILEESQTELIHILNSVNENEKHLDGLNINTTLLQLNTVINEVPHWNHVQNQISITYYFLIFTLVGKKVCIVRRTRKRITCCQHHP